MTVPKIPDRSMRRIFPLDVNISQTKTHAAGRLELKNVSLNSIIYASPPGGDPPLRQSCPSTPQQTLSAIAFPPSPANSEDLDALLSAHGPLTQMCTPLDSSSGSFSHNSTHLGTDTMRQRTKAQLHYRYASILFANQACSDKTSLFYETLLIEDMLCRATPKPELLAISYNICRAYCSQASARADGAPGDLLAVASLALACIWTQDHPPRFTHWARDVCDGDWTARRIDQTVVTILKAIDWRMHMLSSSTTISAAMSLLTPASAHSDSIAISTKATPLTITVSSDGYGTSWAHGQITPGLTPPQPSTRFARANPFLPP